MEELIELKKELQEAINALAKIAMQIRISGENMTNLHADYDNLKNQYLVLLFNEEVELKIKRTESQRTALYRTKYESERRAWLLAENDYKATRDAYSGLQSKITALQTMARLLESQMKLI